MLLIVTFLFFAISRRKYHGTRHSCTRSRYCLAIIKFNICSAHLQSPHLECACCLISVPASTCRAHVRQYRGRRHRIPHVNKPIVAGSAADKNLRAGGRDARNINCFFYSDSDSNLSTNPYPKMIAPPHPSIFRKMPKSTRSHGTTPTLRLLVMTSLVLVWNTATTVSAIASGARPKQAFGVTGKGAWAELNASTATEAVVAVPPVELHNSRHRREALIGHLCKDGYSENEWQVTHGACLPCPDPSADAHRRTRTRALEKIIWMERQIYCLHLRPFVCDCFAGTKKDRGGSRLFQ